MSTQPYSALGAIICSSGDLPSICSQNREGLEQINRASLQQGSGISCLGSPNKSVENFAHACLSVFRRGLGWMWTGWEEKSAHECGPLYDTIQPSKMVCYHILRKQYRM